MQRYTYRQTGFIIRTEKVDMVREQDIPRNYDFVVKLFSTQMESRVQEFVVIQKKLFAVLADWEEFENGE